MDKKNNWEKNSDNLRLLKAVCKQNGGQKNLKGKCA